MKSTVFFGPYIGELGWELLYWHGWVRKACRTTFRDYRKIASSYPGRQPFYPDADEFWPLPDEFVARGFSARCHLVEGWRHGLPGTTRRVRYYRFGFLSRLKTEEHRLTGPDVEPLAEAVFERYARQLPRDAVSFVPWRLNVFKPDRTRCGVSIVERPNGLIDFHMLKIGFEHQFFEPLTPTPAGETSYQRLFPETSRLIAVFPRHRTTQRPDKNWPADRYQALIRQLQRMFPELTVAILGAPGGAHFTNGVPEGCLDMINVPAEQRLGIQLAALKRSALALGSMSGALLVALAAGCRSLIWGHPEELTRYHRENVLGTRLVYHPVIDASVSEIARLTQAMIEGAIAQGPQDAWATVRFLQPG